MDAPLQSLLNTLTAAARRAGLTNHEWAARAGVRVETLSRLKGRGDCDLATLSALALALDFHVSLRPLQKMHLPKSLDRRDEEKLLALTASRSLDLILWRDAGSPFFMAGIAVLLAGVRGMDRAACLLLAEALFPGIGEIDTFAVWVKKSPLRPSRFLPMLAQRMAA